MHSQLTIRTIAYCGHRSRQPAHLRQTRQQQSTPTRSERNRTVRALATEPQAGDHYNLDLSPEAFLLPEASSSCFTFAQRSACVTGIRAQDKQLAQSAPPPDQCLNSAPTGDFSVTPVLLSTLLAASSCMLLRGHRAHHSHLYLP